MKNDIKSLGGEKLLRILLDTMPDVVCFKDGAGRWLEVNKAGLEVFGLSGIDCIGKKDSELAAVSPFYSEALLACEKSDEEAWQAGKVTQVEEVIPVPEGESKVFEVYKVPLFYEDGSRKGLVVLGHDNTAYQLAHEERKQLQRQENIINQLLRIGFQTSSLETQLSEALDIITSLPWLHFAPRGGIFLVSKTQPESLNLYVHKNMAASLLKYCQNIRFGECLCGMAARDKKVFCVPNLPEEHQYRHGTQEEYSHYIVPIVHFDQLLGVLMLYGKADFSCNTGLQNFMNTVASTLALLIDQQEAEDRLQHSEKNLIKAQRLAKMGYWEWLLEENRLLLSDEACQIFEFAPEQAPTSYDEFVAYIHPDDRQRLQDAVHHSLMTKEAFSIQYQIVCENGMQREVYVEGEMELDANGASVRMFGAIQDITQRKQSEKHLALATKVFESSIEGIAITDKNSVIQSVNRAFTHITGYSSEEAIGNKPNILKSDRHDKAFYQKLWSTLRDTGKWKGEIWNRRKSGEVYPEHLTITAIKDEYGRTTHYVAVFHDLSEVRSYEDQLQFQAFHDILTSLPNRQLLLDRLRVAINHARQTTRRVAVLCLDLDNFKHINDSLGHTAGDMLLKQVAERLKQCMIPESTVAHLGGDDFAVLVNQCDDVKDAALMADRLFEQFVEPFNLTSYETFVTASVGITYFPEDGNDAETLLKNAELAMYRAKQEGKNRYQLFAKSMNLTVVRRLSLENSLRKALDRNEFQVYYQPKVSTASGKITGMEALVRWQKADGQLVSPLDFIPLAEETGLIVPIGAYVLRQTCIDTGKWLKQNKNLSVSVNLSARQFTQEGLVAELVSILAETGFPIANLELEVTESVVMGNEEAAIEQLRELKSIGARLALDDFGTGYSSLQYLRKMPIDTLKIDRSFIRDIPDNSESSAIATAIITLARALNLELVAEGVENHAQLDFLRQQSCKDIQIQGYLFSPPVPAAVFSDLLKRTQPYDVLIRSPWVTC